jgi:hypothetical protein
MIHKVNGSNGSNGSISRYTNRGSGREVVDAGLWPACRRAPEPPELERNCCPEWDELSEASKVAFLKMVEKYEAQLRASRETNPYLPPPPGSRDEDQRLQEEYLEQQRLLLKMGKREPGCGRKRKWGKPKLF